MTLNKRDMVDKRSQFLEKEPKPLKKSVSDLSVLNVKQEDYIPSADAKHLLFRILLSERPR